jgi:mercuric ion transport protein
MNNMNQNNLLRTGVAGTVIAALCCFTPVLVILLGTIGLASLVGYLDYVLFPALAFFFALTIYALWRRQPDEDNSNDAEN